MLGLLLPKLISELSSSASPVVAAAAVAPVVLDPPRLMTTSTNRSTQACMYACIDQHTKVKHGRLLAIKREPNTRKSARNSLDDGMDRGVDRGMNDRVDGEVDGRMDGGVDVRFLTTGEDRTGPTLHFDSIARHALLHATVKVNGNVV
jgi:hypothetical protein